MTALGGPGADSVGTGGRSAPDAAAVLTGVLAAEARRPGDSESAGFKLDSEGGGVALTAGLPVPATVVVLAQGGTPPPKERATALGTTPPDFDPGRVAGATGADDWRAAAFESRPP